MTPSPDGVGRTSISVAKLRAVESARADALFTDPLAEHFVAAAGGRPGWRGALGRLRPGALRRRIAMATFIAVRTRFFDDFLRAAGGQVVILAAGMDTRAFRLRFAEGTRVFEIDLPEVLAFKREVLAHHDALPRCERIEVPADLLDDWAAALVAAGFDAGRPTMWTVEGLLVYLTDTGGDRLLRRVGELSAPGSRLAVSHHDQAGVAGLSGDHYRSGLSRDPAEWLSALGWKPTRISRAAELAADHGRALDSDVGLAWLIEACLAGGTDDERSLEWTT